MLDVSLLMTSRLFQNMAEEEIIKALSNLNARIKTFQKGQNILQAGSTADLGFVLKGSATVENLDIWGNCTILSFVKAGQYFAETYALLQESLPVQVRANEEADILFLSLNNHPLPAKMTRNLLYICAQKNKALAARSFHTAPKSVRERILSYLNGLALEKRSLEFDIPFDRQQLADYLNVERTSLSKELGRMRKEGILVCRKNHFKLLSNH